MIKITGANEIEDSFYKGRDFGESISSVRDVISDVQKNGDAALKNYSIKFDRADLNKFEIPLSELENAAKKMQRENPDLYNSLCYSHDLALKFALKQKEYGRIYQL